LRDLSKDESDSIEKSNKTNPVKKIASIKINHNRTKSDIHVKSTSLLEKFITDVKRKKSLKNSFKEEEHLGTCFEIIDEEREDKFFVEKDNDEGSKKNDNKVFEPIKGDIECKEDSLKPVDNFQKTHKTDIDYNLQASTVLLNDSVDEVLKAHAVHFEQVNVHKWKILTPQRDIRLGLLNNSFTKIGLVKTVNAHLDSVRKIDFLDDSTLFSAGDDGLVKEWKLTKKEEKINLKPNFTFRYHEGPILSTATTQNLYFSGDSKGKLSILEKIDNSWNFNRIFNTGNEPIWSLDYSQRDDVIVSTTPNKIKFWNVDQLSEKKPQTFVLSTKNFYTEAKWYDFNKCVIHACNSAYKDSSFIFYDVQKQTEYFKIEHPNTFSNSFKLLKNDHLIVSANNNHTISIYDIRENKPVKTFVAHSNSITALDIQEDSKILITGDLDGSMRLWDFQSFRCIQELSVHRKKYSESIVDIKFNHELQIVATAGADSTIRLFSLN